MKGASSESVCLDSKHSTTRTVFTAGDAACVAAGRAVAEGGLRCRGYCKRSLPEKPLITIATVVFNGAAHLEETIRSVIDLDYDNIEFIIIDGGSRDGTREIIQRFDACIDYWLSEPDAGIYDAMNKAWLNASAESSVLFLGCGDRLISLPAQMGEDEVIYGMVSVGERLFRSTLRYGLRLGNTLHHQALLVPKNLHSAPPFDTTFKVYADFDFNQRLYRHGATFRYDAGLRAFALPGGVSTRLDVKQMAAVTRKNFGNFFACLTALYCSYQRLRQFLRSSGAKSG